MRSDVDRKIVALLSRIETNAASAAAAVPAEPSAVEGARSSGVSFGAPAANV